MSRLTVPILALLLLSRPAFGEEKQEAKFRVRVLLASSQGEVMDDAIGPHLREWLKKSFGTRYTSFKQLDNRLMKVALNETAEMPLPDQTVLKIRFRDVQGEFIKLTMEVKDLRTTIRIKNGGLFFQAGHRYKNGILVLAISANLPGDAEEQEELSPVRPEPRPETNEGRKTHREIEAGTR